MVSQEDTSEYTKLGSTDTVQSIYVRNSKENCGVEYDFGFFNSSFLLINKPLTSKKK